jgi:hypothetical protein
MPWDETNPTHAGVAHRTDDSHGPWTLVQPLAVPIEGEGGQEWQLQKRLHLELPVG